VQAYITCVIGVHYVGFLMLTLSLTTGVTAYISGHLRQYTGRMPLIISGQSAVQTLCAVEVELVRGYWIS